MSKKYVTVAKVRTEEACTDCALSWNELNGMKLISDILLDCSYQA